MLLQLRLNENLRRSAAQLSQNLQKLGSNHNLITRLRKCHLKSLAMPFPGNLVARITSNEAADREGHVIYQQRMSLRDKLWSGNVNCIEKERSVSWLEPAALLERNVTAFRCSVLFPGRSPQAQFTAHYLLVCGQSQMDWRGLVHFWG